MADAHSERARRSAAKVNYTGCEGNTGTCAQCRAPKLRSLASFALQLVDTMGRSAVDLGILLACGKGSNDWLRLRCDMDHIFGVESLLLRGVCALAFSCTGRVM